MQYFSDEQLDDMFGLLELDQLQMMGYDSVHQVADRDELEDLLMAIEEDFSNLDREEKIEELRSIGAFEDEDLVDEVKFFKYNKKRLGAETKRQRLKREKDEAAMDEAATDVEYMREHYAESNSDTYTRRELREMVDKRCIACEKNVPGVEGSNYFVCDECVDDDWASSAETEEGNTPVMPPHEFGQPVQWRPHDERISALKRQRAESLVEADPDIGETLVLIADRDTTITQYGFHYSTDYDGQIDGADVDVEDEMVIKKGDIVLFHFSDDYYGGVADGQDLVGYYDGDYYESGNPESMWGIENPEDWTLIETVSDENSPNWGGRDSEPRIVHTPGGRSWRFTISGVGKGDDEVEAFRDFVTSTKIGEANKWERERMSAETFAADSPFNTLLQIRDDVIIEEEEDFHTLLQIYLSLEDDIAALYAAGMEKHGLLPEMMRYRNQIAMRLDAIQDEVAIQDTIEMDAEWSGPDGPYSSPLFKKYKPELRVPATKRVANLYKQGRGVVGDSQLSDFSIGKDGLPKSYDGLMNWQRTYRNVIRTGHGPHTHRDEEKDYQILQRIDQKLQRKTMKWLAVPLVLLGLGALYNNE